MQDEAVMTCLELMMAAVQRKEPPARFSFIQEETTETKPETGLVCVIVDVYYTFFHHYQGSIDFNTVNIHSTVEMYFLVSTSNRGDIE